MELQSYISTPIPDLATALQTKIKTDYNVDISFDNLLVFLSDYETVSEGYKLQLSYTKPDFEQIKQQFISRLRQTDSWRDLIQAGVGETILEFVAAIGDYGQTSILRAYQETSYDARLTSSVYTITRSLGVHIDRKIPAKVSVKLWGETTESLSALAIPSFSQFSIAGNAFFNRDTIVFNNNTEDNPLIVELYQGNVQIESFISLGTPFQTIEIGDNDYRVSNDDIHCYIDNSDEYTRVLDGLWHYDKDQKVFSENTTPNGNVEILFGNSVFGKIPEVSKVMNFVYVLTDGADANTTQGNQTVILVDINEAVPDAIRNSNIDVTEAQIDQLKKNVIGLTNSAVYNGGDERDKEFYAAVGPSIRASDKKMVTRPDHYGLGLKFPNIKDVYFQGQKELDRNNRNYINVVGVTVLTKDGIPFTKDEWADYIKYLENIQIARVNFLRIDPIPVDFDISGDIYCTRNTDKTNAKSFIRYSVNEFFKIDRGSLGKSVYENDIEDIYKAKYSNIRVDYAQNVKPNYDTILTKIQYPRLRSFDCNVYYSDRNYKSVAPRIK